jgi:hypothetical protein
LNRIAAELLYKWQSQDLPSDFQAYRAAANRFLVFLFGKFWLIQTQDSRVRKREIWEKWQNLNLIFTIFLIKEKKIESESIELFRRRRRIAINRNHSWEGSGQLKKSVLRLLAHD